MDSKVQSIIIIIIIIIIVIINKILIEMCSLQVQKIFIFYLIKILYLLNNTGKYLIILDLVMVMVVIIFTMQSKSLVGPTSSFMYQNP